MSQKKMGLGENETDKRASRKPASLVEEVRNLDPRKQTVCALTLNSEEEKNLFRTHLGEKDFNYIELTNREGEQDDWFMNACRSGVKCDVLVVSGHFGGRFFGKSGLSLQLEELEKSACQSECDGILKNPKEVFLFGCNTLASKKKDHRTLADYVARLIDDDFNRADAERAAAFRYSPFGDTNEARMRRAFKGAKKLYGFDSVAPSGKNISGSLNTYFKKIGNYKKHLMTLDPKVKNQALAQTLKWTPFVEAIGWGDVKKSATCYLEDPNIQDIEKLNWIKETFADTNSGLQNSVFIHQYLSEIEQREVKWTPSEVKALEDIRGLTKMRTTLEAIIKTHVTGMTQVQGSVASLMRLIGWWSPEQYRLWSEDKIGSLFSSSLSREKIDDICSAGLRLDFLPAQLRGNPMNWSTSTLEVIQCLQPSHPELAEPLLQVAQKHANVENRVFAIRALRSLGAFNSRVQDQMIRILETENEPRVLEQVTMMLRNATSMDDEKIMHLVNIVRTPQFFMRGAGAAEVLGALKIKDVAIQKILVQTLGTEESSVHEATRAAIAEALKVIKPRDPALIKELIEIISKGTEYDVKYGAAGVVSVIPHLSIENQIILAENVRSHPHQESRNASLVALGGSFPLNSQVRAILEDAEKRESVYFVKAKINSVLNYVPPLIN